MTQYLSKSNVQLGASYHTGSISNTKYEEGYQAAARYINAGRDEIGNALSLFPDVIMNWALSDICVKKSLEPRQRSSS